MATDSVDCAAGLTSATLSAWRDDLLSPPEWRRVGQHVIACAACQTRLGQFHAVAQALRGQRELEPGGRIVAGVRQRAARTAGRGKMPRGPWWKGLAVLGPVAAVLLLFVYVLQMGLGPQRGISARSTPQASPTANPTAIATATPGSVTVSDPTIALQLTFAFVRDNDVWVSWRGKVPEQMTHFGLAAQQLQWSLVWSEDQSELLAVAQTEPSPGSQAQAQGWIISVLTGGITQLPSSSPVVAATNIAVAWIGDRYIVYEVTPASHFSMYNVYDTQTQRALATSMETYAATEAEVRGTAVYFTDYQQSWADSGPTPGIVRRYDLASNTVTTAFTVPAMLVSQGIPAGGWNLSADASHILSWSVCLSSSCPVYYQGQSGSATKVFSPQLSSAVDYSLAPDGKHAAALVTDSTGNALRIVQQAVPTGAELTSALPNGGDNILGWTTQQPGILVEKYQVDARQNVIGIAIYYAPVGTNQAAHLVETVQGRAAFALPVG